jgi:hypothetical protein
MWMQGEISSGIIGRGFFITLFYLRYFVKEAQKAQNIKRDTHSQLH